MRIIGEIPHTKFKITIFEVNNKFLVKIENDEGLEQVYRYFIGGAIRSVSDIKTMISPSFLQTAQTVFLAMQKNRTQNLPQINDSEFERII